jgi:trk system potassium uptake protein TrkH
MMITEPLNRSILSNLSHRLVILDEKIDVPTAVKLMHSEKAETLIIRNNSKDFIGIVTKHDIIEKVVIKGGSPNQIQLKSIMSSPIIAISSKANVRDALELMNLNSIKRLPIIDNGHMLGIVTLEDLDNSVKS